MADDKKIIFSMVGVSKAFQANKQVLKDIDVYKRQQMEGLAEAVRSVILSNQDSLKNVDIADLQQYGKGSSNLDVYKRQDCISLPVEYFRIHIGVCPADNSRYGTP